MALTRRSNELFCAAIYYTDKALSIDPKTTSYDEWKGYMNTANEYWSALEDVSEKMEKEIKNDTFEDMYRKYQTKAFNPFNNVAYAIDSNEIIQVFYSAPAGKRLRTLAKHYNKDLNWARSALKMANGQITAAEWNNYANTAETLEKASRTARLTAKVVAQVAVTATAATATGGTSLLASGYALVEGASTIIQVLDYCAFILMCGDAYYSSGFVANLNAVSDLTAPITGTVGLLTLDFSNTKDAIMSSLKFAEQINSLFVENKVIGIQLNGLNKKATITKMTKEDLAGYIQAKRSGDELTSEVKDLLDTLENKLGDQAENIFNQIVDTQKPTSSPIATPEKTPEITPEPIPKSNNNEDNNFSQFVGSWTCFYTAVWGKVGDGLPSGYSSEGECIFMTINEDKTVDWTINSADGTNYYTTSIDVHDGKWYLNNFLTGWQEICIGENGYLYEKFRDACTDTINKNGYYVYYRTN
jgi:uncharacterized protein (UPF0297 family)